VMEGKERVNRSRAGSNGSSRKGVDGTPLSRQVTERLVDAKLQRGETPSFPDLRSHSSRPGSRPKTSNSNKPKGQHHERDTSSPWESSESGTVRQRKRKPPPIAISPSAMSSGDSIDHIPVPSEQLSTGSEREKREHPGRPVLTTIISSSNVVPQTSKEEDGYLPLRELSPPSDSALNSRAPSPANRLPPNANSMPASIPSVESKFPGSSTFVFPRPNNVEMEN